ncbi:MAG TPA: ergothioneine biosynthesis protein EgtB [Bacteroidales bacterium]|nr:ergothioneine biosynthesis protein EgtB [Bacteroidales bacterium]
MVADISQRFIQVRNQTASIANSIHPEDSVVQTDTEVSPPKWHLAHTTWFFENFILKQYIKGYKPYHPSFDFLFNSYYQSQGTRVNRNRRGYHPRPLLSEVLEYRKAIEEEIISLLFSLPENEELKKLLELGIHHEQQHQELLLTDLKNIWSRSPLFPSLPLDPHKNGLSTIAKWLSVEEGLIEVGFHGNTFHYDNESPRHKVYLDDFEIASRPVLNSEYLEFINAGGYQQWQYWLHEGWDWVQTNHIKSPLYWDKIDDSWYVYSLSGFNKIDEQEIVTHISYYEADAYARWRGFRLPTEQEWEVAASLYGNKDVSYNFLNNGFFHPTSVDDENKAFLGQVWEWTNSSYLAYPGFKPWDGDVGEYNGKFMINQMVLRGGSCVTPQDHIRTTYRNFFHPHLRWQFTGIRLAKNLQA